MIKLCTWLTNEESLIYWYLFRKAILNGDEGYFGWAYNTEEGALTSHLFKTTPKSWRDVAEKTPKNIEKVQRDIIVNWFVNPRDIKFLE